jgi:hypothetical protein
LKGAARASRLPVVGTSSAGIGFAWNSRRVGFASKRAQKCARLWRALSVEMPVPAYIWRYSFDTNKNAKRPRMDDTQRDRSQIDRTL